MSSDWSLCAKCGLSIGDQSNIGSQGKRWHLACWNAEDRKAIRQEEHLRQAVAAAVAEERADLAKWLRSAIRENAGSRSAQAALRLVLMEIEKRGVTP